jgi:hypothetical protein
MQADVYSLHADEWIRLLEQLGVLRRGRPLDERLLDWDRRYTLDSTESDLLDRFLAEALSRAYSRVLGREAWDFVANSSLGSVLGAHVWERPLREWPASLEGLLWPRGQSQAPFLLPPSLPSSLSLSFSFSFVCTVL